MAVTNGGKCVNSMMNGTITLRKATESDLASINEIIDAAVMSWNLPERVKRLSLPTYRYKPHDLETLELIVAENSEHRIVGIAAWEPVGPVDAVEGYSALLLHGIYVNPEQQHQGIGSQLLRTVEQTAIEKEYSGLMVKAQASAAGFFLSRGMQPLEVVNEKRDYAYRYWKLLNKRGEK